MAATPSASGASTPVTPFPDVFTALDAHAIPFITIVEDGGSGNDAKFEVNPDAVKYLKSLTGKVAVVAIAGLYRTGKSYLLNALMGKGAGFTVGPTVKACTKGIWLWGKAIEVEGSDMTVLFLDTEGLGSTIRGASYDSRIFALALLLSSYFVYNSTGVIDGDAISRLSLVVNLTKYIHVQAHADSEPGSASISGDGAVSAAADAADDFQDFFPKFLWVVRDFSVKIERDGVAMSSKQYLEEALHAEAGSSDLTAQKNAVRAVLRSFFPQRDCITMVSDCYDV